MRACRQLLVLNQPDHGDQHFVMLEFSKVPCLGRLHGTYRKRTESEGDSVHVIKIGCAGWWYVRLTAYPFSEGWAPSTYLEKLPVRNKTLDRR